MITVATDYCMARRSFMIVDLPASVNTVDAAQAWVAQAAVYASPNAGGGYAAAYFPAVQIPDPISGYRLRTSAPSGTMAGIYALTDASRGVWTAPAGVQAVLNGVVSLACPLNDEQNGLLNPLGLNALRTLPAYGNVAWGALTLAGGEAVQSEWKFAPVRRLGLFIENSLASGLQWAVFEPNDEALWSRIGLETTAFMQKLYQEGAFAGATASQSYFVTCDATTTSAQDQADGVVNVQVGFSPVHPAEFIIISFQQAAGQPAA